MELKIIKDKTLCGKSQDLRRYELVTYGSIFVYPEDVNRGKLVLKTVGGQLFLCRGPVHYNDRSLDGDKELDQRETIPVYAELHWWPSNEAC